jgi:ABC-type Fe2+-enterobactin transport system substrate-binding protein
MKPKLLAMAVLLTTLGFTFPVLAIESHSRDINTKAMLLAQASWQAFTSELGKFTVQMPRRPQAETTVPADFGGQQVNVHQIVVQNNGTSYIVVYTDLPSSFIQKGSQQVLDELSNKFLANLGLQELKNRGKKIDLNGNPGREFQTGNSGKFFGMRVYLVGQRSYLLLTQAPTSRDVNQFLSSFQLQ